jgi:hypothetical protein
MGSGAAVFLVIAFPLWREFIPCLDADRDSRRRISSTAVL